MKNYYSKKSAQATKVNQRRSMPTFSQSILSIDMLSRQE
jgi:hypothetical protein